jgi:hypothetical protein
MSSVEIPEHVLANGPVDVKAPADVPVEGVDYAQCPECTRKVKLTRLGYFEPHDETLRGGDRCPVSGVRYEHARRVNDAPLPGDGLGATPVPEVKDSSTPAANRGLGGSSSEKVPPATDTSSLIDWSKVGDLTHPDVPADSLAFTGSSATTRTVEERVAALPDGTMELEGEPWPEPVIEGTPLGPREVPAPDAGSGVSTEINSLELTSTSGSSEKSWVENVLDAMSNTSNESPVEPPSEIFSLGTTLSAEILQPFSPFLQPEPWIPPTLVFLQPVEYEGPAKGEPMGDLAKELATRIKETFYAYSNRKTTDNRSAQTTLGPSEIGTPCDRRLAMSLLGIPPVNPGGDGWAAFVGTCTHAGMAEVYTFADAGTGRYAVELPVFLGMPTVPRGTTDLLDRRDGVVVDWKVMGAYSLKKFKLEGPSATYRTQAHVYGLGAERGGEKVRNVAIVGLPRAGRSLDEMHIWTEKFDRKFAQAALDRVEKIANEIATLSGLAAIGETDVTGPMAAAAEFETADDCTYCDFHLKGDRDMVRGCPGR